MYEFADTLLVSTNFMNGEDTGVLIVGRKKIGGSVDIVNAFQGEEARELYKKLVTKVEKGE